MRVHKSTYFHRWFSHVGPQDLSNRSLTWNINTWDQPRCPWRSVIRSCDPKLVIWRSVSLVSKVTPTSQLSLVSGPKDSPDFLGKSGLPACLDILDILDLIFLNSTHKTLEGSSKVGIIQSRDYPNLDYKWRDHPKSDHVFLLDQPMVFGDPPSEDFSASYPQQPIIFAGLGPCLDMHSSL